jgi:hypothetical protein
MTPDDWLPASMRPARRGKQGVPDPARDIVERFDNLIGLWADDPEDH